MRGRWPPELIRVARLGAKWHGAHNKAAAAANVKRNAVIALDMNGLAASYDDLAAADKKVEVVTCMLRSGGQHAARQHRERTAALVLEISL